MEHEEIKAILADCQFQDYELQLMPAVGHHWHLRGVYVEADTVTGREEQQRTRPWVITRTMTKSEIVATAFKCCMTSMEHRTREWFLYKGRAIYMPHYDVEQLWAVCDDRKAEGQ